MAESNRLLRQARLARSSLVARRSSPSPSGSGVPMSRQELADSVNLHLHARGVSTLVATAGYLARLERGQSRWPRVAYREALRAVLGASTDAELGFVAHGQHSIIPRQTGISFELLDVVRGTSPRECCWTQSGHPMAKTE